MARFSELRDRSLDDLNQVYDDLCRELYDLRSQRREAGQLEKPHKVGELKREIARVLTIMNEKQSTKAGVSHES